ncbi:MAG: DUF2294 domain-containing protein [Oscillatoriales cyanobacterium RU_3_3]|nr:DUF2294 domain-containing protein [Oscillatoriales cyanobacterium RU_3_3]
MTVATLEPTRGQLERNLSQRIQALYRSLLGHQPSQVSCNLIDNKLAIAIENAITQPEQLLAENGQEELAEKVRSELETVLESQMKDLINEVLGVDAIDLLNDATLETGRAGTIAILSSAPKVREPSSKSKTQPKQLQVEAIAHNSF